MSTLRFKTYEADTITERLAEIEKQIAVLKASRDALPPADPEIGRIDIQAALLDQELIEIGLTIEQPEERVGSMFGPHPKNVPASSLRHSNINPAA